MLNVMKNAKSKVYKHLISKMLDSMGGGSEPKKTVDSDDEIPSGTEEGEKEDLGENKEDVGGQDDNKSNVREMLKTYMKTKSSHHGTMQFSKKKSSQPKPEIKGFKKV